MRGFAGPERRQVEHGKGDGEAEGVILHVGREAVDAAEDLAVGLRAGAARVGGALQVEARKVGALQRAELRLGLFDRGVLLQRDRDSPRGRAAGTSCSGGS